MRVSGSPRSVGVMEILEAFPEGFNGDSLGSQNPLREFQFVSGTFYTVLYQKRLNGISGVVSGTPMNFRCISKGFRGFKEISRALLFVLISLRGFLSALEDFRW